VERLAVLLTALSPVGGMVAALPLGILGFGFPWWGVALVGIAAGWAQALVVDLCWELLERWPWWRRMMARRRTGWIARGLSRPGTFWPIVVATPLVGPWVVMALMRFAGVPRSRVTPPLLLGLVFLAAVLVLTCHHAPRLFTELLAEGVVHPD